MCHHYRFYESGLRFCSLALDTLCPITNSKRLTKQGSYWTREPSTPRILMTHVESLQKEMLCWCDLVTIELLDLWRLLHVVFNIISHQVIWRLVACLLWMIYNCLFKGDWLPIVIREAIKVMTIIEWDYQLLVSQPQTRHNAFKSKIPTVPQWCY